MAEKGKKVTPEPVAKQHHFVREGAFIAFIAICGYLLIALATYNSGDPGWSHTVSNQLVQNAAGLTGAWLADVFYALFGYMAYLFPVLLAYRAWLIFRERSHSKHFDGLGLAMRFLGFVLVMAGTTAIAHLNGLEAPTVPEGPGGILGQIVGESARGAFNLIGARLLLLAMLLFGLTIFTGISWLKLMDETGRVTIAAWQGFFHWRDRRKQAQEAKKQSEQHKKQREVVIKASVAKELERKPLKIDAAPKQAEQSKRVIKEKQTTLFAESVVGTLPPLELLNQPTLAHKKGFSKEALEAMSRLLEIKLKDFGIDAEVVAVYPGPVITRFEVQPAAGVKVSRISNLAKDLARSLAVISVRVVEVIPGKSVIGIEIPNEDREMVMLSQVLSSKVYDDAKSPSTIALGHDISGQPVVADLAKMPHLLVAGTTGSGKSVGVNAMLISMLYKSGPDVLRLMLVDPKMLELSVYDGIPHLLTPVITDMKDAANGLRWCVGEMERRYKLMAALGVRNLAGYNRKVEDAQATGNPIPDPLWTFSPEDLLFLDEDADPPTAPPLTTLPVIVVVIDEFADMMMIVGKKVEELIARIAQKARAAGIHLILATQRPSVDVITGLIKANVPTRMAFQVSSKIDSRTILDQGGAEQLLGQGDMLYLPPGTGLPVRIHGAFVDDDEVHRVVADWKQRGRPDYIDGLLTDGANESLPGIASNTEDGDAEESDALYDEAVAFVTKTRKASISSVQRKLRIGYNRAARMIEAMEMAGVVTEMSTNGQREVLAPAPPED
ncbi:MAG: DNA translocase FtsK 4TM domain-containing protein [Pseudomonadales bacterium]